jgi:RNA polymerase sigma-70 factor (ECF subfamily)
MVRHEVGETCLRYSPAQSRSERLVAIERQSSNIRSAELMQPRTPESPLILCDREISRGVIPEPHYVRRNSLELLRQATPVPGLVTPALPCVSRYYPQLLALARSRIGPQLRARLDPADIAQDSLLKSLKARGQFGGQSESQLRAWLRSILTTTVANAVRSFKRSNNYTRPAPVEIANYPDPDAACPERNAIRNEERQRLFRALVQLPSDQRTTVELRFVCGCSLRDISAQTGRTKASIGGLLYRGLKRLRTMLADDSKRSTGG